MTCLRIIFTHWRQSKIVPSKLNWSQLAVSSWQEQKPGEKNVAEGRPEAQRQPHLSVGQGLAWKIRHITNSNKAYWRHRCSSSRGATPLFPAARRLWAKLHWSLSPPACISRLSPHSSVISYIYFFLYSCMDTVFCLNSGHLSAGVSCYYPFLPRFQNFSTKQFTKTKIFLSLIHLTELPSPSLGTMSEFFT